MEKAVLIMEFISFTLLTIFLLYSLIVMIKNRIEEKREAKRLSDGLNQIKDAIIQKVAEAEVKTEKKKDSKKQHTEKNYEDMTISELKKIAQSKKIKGYYNLKKEQLIKTLKETEILPE